MIVFLFICLLFDSGISCVSGSSSRVFKDAESRSETILSPNGGRDAAGTERWSHMPGPVIVWTQGNGCADNERIETHSGQVLSILFFDLDIGSSGGTFTVTTT